MCEKRDVGALRDGPRAMQTTGGVAKRRWQHTYIDGIRLHSEAEMNGALLGRETFFPNAQILDFPCLFEILCHWATVAGQVVGRHDVGAARGRRLPGGAWRAGGLRKGSAPPR